MSLDSTLPPDDDDHLTDSASDNDYSPEGAGFFSVEEEDFDEPLDERRSPDNGFLLEELEEARRADDEDFQEKLEALRERGIRRANAILHDEEKSEELVDQKIVHLFAQRKRPSNGAPLDRWFLHCVENAAKDFLRSPASKRADEKVLLDMKSEDDTPLETVLRNEAITMIRRALAKLSYEDQELLRLKFFTEATLEEMTILLNAPLSTINSRITRAKKRLEKNLRKGGNY